MSLLRLVPAFVLVLALLAACCVAGEGPVGEKPVHLSVWGAAFSDMAREIEYQTGVPVRLQNEGQGDETAGQPVYLVTGQVPLSAVLETVARRFGLRFRITPERAVEFSRGYDWVPDRGELRFLRLRPLAGAGLPPEATRELLREILKPLSLLPGHYSVGLEPYPLPDDTDALRALAVLPPVLADYLERAVQCLLGEAGDYPPNPLRPVRYLARARPSTGDWESLLARPVSSPRGRDLKTILSDIADQAAVAIMVTVPPSSQDRPLPADIDRYLFGRVTEVLATERGLGRRVFVADGGVVFEPGPDGTFLLDARSREFFWEGLAVAGFQVGEAVRRHGSGDNLIAAIRREVFPPVWRDAVCGLVYSPGTERLAVIAPENVVEALALWLESDG